MFPARPPRVPHAVLVAGLALAAVFASPGPGWAAEGTRRTGDTRFSVRRGVFSAPIEVAITTRTAGATIRFTTNGSLPDAHTGTVYTGPIPIRTTTVLRAAAFGGGLAPSDVDTQTYLFPAATAVQDGAGFPATWGFNEGRPVPADYAMDPDIVGHPAYRDAILPALRSLPSVCLTLTQDDLFDPKRGIYANPRETGSGWERPATLEWIESEPAAAVRVEAGLRIQGGWNRRPEESPKHAFRVVFRKRYGPGKWKHPLFAGSGATEFDELILRAGCNNTWLHWSGVERRRGDYLRDAWMRETYAAMGHPSARGRFVHLYLNGLYWGLYNLTERPSAPFAAFHGGGAPGDYDVRNGDNLVEGDDVAWRRLVQEVEAGVAGARLAELLDLPAFADYLILNLYGANGDWDGASNWYAARRRTPPGPFRFFVWDGERTLENPADNTIAFDAPSSPPGLFQKLRRDPEFRRLFAERARLHLTGNGVLTPEPAAARYAALARSVEKAIVAESARWGDYRRDAHPYREGPYELYTRDDHWAPEVRRLLEAYFPKRASEVLRQFREAGLAGALP